MRLGKLSKNQTGLSTIKNNNFLAKDSVRQFHSLLLLYYAAFKAHSDTSRKLPWYDMELNKRIIQNIMSLLLTASELRMGGNKAERERARKQPGITERPGLKSKQPNTHKTLATGYLRQQTKTRTKWFPLLFFKDCILLLIMCMCVGTCTWGQRCWSWNYKRLGSAQFIH